MLNRVLVRLAAPAGIAARVAPRFLPGVLGAALVTAGVWAVYYPAGLVTAGVFLLILDRKVP